MDSSYSIEGPVAGCCIHIHSNGPVGTGEELSWCVSYKSEAA